MSAVICLLQECVLHSGSPVSNNSCYSPASAGTCWPGMAGLVLPCGAAPGLGWRLLSSRNSASKVSGLVTRSLGFAWLHSLLPTPRKMFLSLGSCSSVENKSPSAASPLVWGLCQHHSGSGWATLARSGVARHVPGMYQACTRVLRSIIHRPPAPGVGSAPPCPFLPALSAPLALPIRCHIHCPTLLAPSHPALSPPRPPPCPMAASSGSWVTFSLQLLEAPPCPLPLCLEWNGASFVTVSFKRSNLFRGVTWLLCQQLLVLAQLCCSSCQSRMRHPCPLVLGVLSGPLSAHGKSTPSQSPAHRGLQHIAESGGIHPLFMERGAEPGTRGLSCTTLPELCIVQGWLGPAQGSGGCGRDPPCPAHIEP